VHHGSALISGANDHPKIDLDEVNLVLIT